MDEKKSKSLTAAQGRGNALHTPSEMTDNANFSYLNASTTTTSTSERDFEYSSKNQQHELQQQQQQHEHQPSLSSTAFASFFDAEGRLVEAHSFRRAVFQGGIDPACRPLAWKFLFGVFPFYSTPRERDILSLEMKLNYEAMKERWRDEAAKRRLDLTIEGLEEAAAGQGKGREAREAGAGGRDIISRGIDDDADKNHEASNLNGVAEKAAYNDNDVERDDDDDDDDSSSSPETAQRISFMRIQATLSAHRLFEMSDGDSFADALKSVHKDVTRTDRDTDFYRGDSARGRGNLVRLRDVLMTFAAYNKTIGYVQGMNDLLARFQR